MLWTNISKFGCCFLLKSTFLKEGVRTETILERNCLDSFCVKFNKSASLYNERAKHHHLLMIDKVILLLSMRSSAYYTFLAKMKVRQVYVKLLHLKIQWNLVKAYNHKGNITLTPFFSYGKFLKKCLLPSRHLPA